MSRFAISSWSLDGMLQAGVPLLSVPAQMARHGIATLELCHFHLPSTAAAYMEAFREALAAAGVELGSVLIDAGDITAPDAATLAADLRMVEDWIGIAAALGTRQVRIAAGDQPATADVIQTSAQHLRACAEKAADRGLRVITENWRATGEQPADLLAILKQCRGQVGLCADTGNAEATPDKYATLAQLLPQATSVHFKARYYSDGSIDREDAERCTALMRAAGFDGVVTLIYADKHDEWSGIEHLRAVLQPLI